MAAGSLMPLEAIFSAAAFRIGNLRISLSRENPEVIVIDRDGEGGHFSLQEFHDMVQQFVRERL